MTRYLNEKEIFLINSIEIKKYSPKEQTGIKDLLH